MSRRAVVVTSFAGLAVVWNVGDVGALADPLARAYGVTLATIGLFTTALFVTHTAVAFPGGAAIDRLGARTVALAGLLLVCACNVAALAAPDEAVALAARTVMGVGTGAAWVAGIDLVRAAGGSALAQGLYGGVGIAGAGLALAALPPLEPALGWRTPYLSALVVDLVAAAALTTVPAGRRPPPRSRSLRGAGGVGSLLRDARLYRIAALLAVGGGLTVLLGNWIVPLLHHAGYSQVAAGAIGSLILVGGVVSRPLGGWITFRHPSWTRRAVGLSLAGGGVGTAVLATAPPPALAVAATAVIGVAGGVAFAPSFTGAAQARPDAPGAAIGAINAAANAVVVVGTPLIGLTFALPGQGRIGFLAAAILWVLPLAALPSARDLGLVDGAARPGPVTADERPLARR